MHGADLPLTPQHSHHLIMTLHPAHDILTYQNASSLTPTLHTLKIAKLLFLDIIFVVLPVKLLAWPGHGSAEVQTIKCHITYQRHCHARLIKWLNPEQKEIRKTRTQISMSDNQMISFQHVTSPISLCIMRVRCTKTAPPEMSHKSSPLVSLSLSPP